MQNTPLALVILDGWGYDPKHKNNAIAMANTPNWDSILEEYSYTLLDASGNSVGLPDGQMGNSEVGHMVIGAGRTIHQDLSRINSSMKEDGFSSNSCLTNTIKNANRIHLIGLVSDGGIHSHKDHLLSLLQLCKDNHNQDVHIHAILDGRDTPPKSAKLYIEEVTNIANKLALPGITSITGRFYSMDRDKRYERTRASYDLLTTGISEFVADSALDAVEQAYLRGETDEFVKPTKMPNFEKINDGDTVIFFNFRADRARQLSYALTDENFSGFKRNTLVNLSNFVTFTNYANEINAQVAFPKPQLENIFGKICADNDLSQLRVAETEKYAHVTFFFNGGNELPFHKEERILIPSPKVNTYDLEPKMSAEQVCDNMVKAILGKSHNIIITNFANADMVGHTGNLKATITAIEFLDVCLGKIIQAIKESNGVLLITADHGNADCMFNEKTNQPHTAHTNALVPFVLVSNNKYKLKQINGTLADVAPTMLNLLNIEKPLEMTGNSLLDTYN